MSANSLETILAALFWACAGLVLYAYAGYAAAIWLLARVVGPERPVESTSSPAAAADAGVPTVSLLIAAYNEEAVIAERVRNALELRYPCQRIEIVIASDGSTDATAQIVRQFDGQRVRLLDSPRRRGKAAVVNAAVDTLSSEVILFSDANTAIDPDAAANLVRWFRDPSVGAVCGRLVLTDPTTGRNADGLYWRYETFLKRCEGKLGALLGSNGAIYAMRRELFVPIPGNTIVDDFVIPLLGKLRTGCRIIYDDQAIAREE